MSNRTRIAIARNGNDPTRTAVEEQEASSRSGEEAGRRRVGLLDRTLSNLSRALRGVGVGAGTRLRGGTVRPDLPADDQARVRDLMIQCLTGPGGEVSRRGRAAELGRLYLDLDRDGQAALSASARP